MHPPFLLSSERNDDDDDDDDDDNDDDDDDDDGDDYDDRDHDDTRKCRPSRARNVSLIFWGKKNSDPTKSSAQVNWFVLNLLCDGFSRHLCCECILMKITDTGGDCD